MDFIFCYVFDSMVCLVGFQEGKRCFEKCMFFYLVLVFSNISNRNCISGA